MSFIGALLGFGGQYLGEATSNKSHQCRENRKRRFTREKKAQRLARRLNREG